MHTWVIEAPAEAKPRKTTGFQQLSPRQQRGTRGDRILRGVQRNRLRELRAIGIVEYDEIGIISPYDAFPEILSNAMGYLRWARKMAGEVSEDNFWIHDSDTGEKIPCAEFELEMRLMLAVKAVCESMIRLDIDTHMVKVEESKVDLLGSALQEACRRIGIPPDQRKALGRELRSQLQDIEGNAHSAD